MCPLDAYDKNPIHMKGDKYTLVNYCAYRVTPLLSVPSKVLLSRMKKKQKGLWNRVSSASDRFDIFQTFDEKI